MLQIKGTPFHSFSREDTGAKLEASVHGLSESAATQRLETYGPNEITEKKKDPAWKKLLAQFLNILIIILILAAVVSAVMGETIEAISIIVIVVLAGFLGFIQEFQAEKAIASLKKMAAHKALVLRDGVEKVIESSLLVPGDVVVLKTGDTIPADCRLIEAANMKVEESALTGESQGVEKNADSALPESCSIGDRINMVFSGTSISNGRSKAYVCATGDVTEFGKIAQMLQAEPDKKTPLQENLDSLGGKIGIFAIIVAVIMAVAGVWRGEELMRMFIWGVALAVAVIPEALPAVVTISLALGVRRMVKRRALIRKLPAVETLGAVNIICSDKTGTLTEDQMTIRKVYVDGTVIDVTGGGYDPKGEFRQADLPFDPESTVFRHLLRAGSLCNDSRLKHEAKWTITGDPTEGALVVLAAKAGMNSDTMRETHPRVDEDPFTSEKKRMTTYHEIDGAMVAYSKGAGEIILGACASMETGAGPVALTDAKRAELQKLIESFAEQSLRVIGVASKLKEKGFKAGTETGMTLIGLVGMIDPPRPEAAAAIRKCETAGIRPVMITGDHKMTAVAIARELGILKGGKAFSGEEIERMSEEQFQSVVEETEVFARISPAHKHKIVDALIVPAILSQGRLDFLSIIHLTRSYVCLAEAKKDDFEQGTAQCILAMKTCQLLNAKENLMIDMHFSSDGSR